MKRRASHLILIAGLLLSGLGALSPQFHNAAAAAPPNAIQVENAKAGDASWDQFASVAKQDAINGYGSSISVNRGSSIDFFVTTTAASFTIDVFRTGWYGGAGARKVVALGSFPGVHQAIPPPDPVTGMVACNWQKTTTLSIPTTWTTGVYLAKLSAVGGNQSFIFFVVRNDGGTEAINFQTSVTTYQAYNEWGGLSLYNNATNNSVYRYAHATKVSFDRPFDPNDSNGAGHYLYTEYPFVRWAEKQGYDLTYTSDVDTHTNVNPLTNHRAFLSIGHDEYWSKGMRDNLQNAINAGMNAAFFSANSVFWQIRFEPNAAGVPNRVEVGYKEFANSPGAPGPDPQWNVNNPIVTTHFREAPVNQPENALLGVMYQDQVSRDYAYVVQNASNWIYAGTGFVNGTSVPGIVGYEYDKVWNNGQTPPGLIILSSSPVVGCCEGSGSSTANSTLYTAASGARVFAAGTIQWSYGLDNYNANYVNAGIQKTTANILDNFGSGVAPAAPAVSLSRTSVPFGNQVVNTTSGAQTVTVTNSGTAALTINSIAVGGTNAGDFAQTNTCPLSPNTVAVGASCTVSATFTPSATGSRAASVAITDNASGSPHTIALSGTGTAPAVSLSPTSVTFASQAVNTTSAAQTDTLTNSGTAPLTISSISLGGFNPGDFAQTNTCPVSPATLAAGANCSISLTFTPTATGSRTASVSVADNASGIPHTVTLSGTGAALAPAVSLSRSSIGFGNQVVNTTSAPQGATLTNTGTAPLTISGVTVGGTNPADFAQTNTCPISPATLGAGANCSISASFTPTTSGSRTASVSIADDASGSPHTVALAGTGTAPAVSLSATSLSFGTQTINTSSGSQAVTLTNSGSAPLTISGISLGGVNPGDFAQTNTCPTGPTTLAAGANCSISATFTPTDTGTRTATLSITDDASGSPQSVALSGTGATAAPAVSLSRTSVAFGNQMVNTSSAAQPVTLTNSGSAPLTISGVTLGGTNPGDFAQTNTCPISPATLAAGANCSISATFTPTATGGRAASLSIADDAGGSPHVVALSGTGTAPVVSLSSNTVTFASQTVNTTSAAQAVTVTNTGTAPLTISSIGLGGVNPGDFAQTNTCPLSPGTLAAGAGCTITMTFTPTATGSRTASLSIADNASGSPQTVALSGTGAAAATSLFSDGFESGTLPGAWTATVASSTNTNSLDTTLKHSGTASLKAIMTKGSAGNAYVSKTITGQTTLDVRGYYYLSSPVNWGAVQLISLYAQGQFIGWVTYYYDPSTPTLTIYNGANNVSYNCTQVPSLNAWHSLELQYVLSTTTSGSVALWLDGVQVCGKTAIKTQPFAGLTINQVVTGVDTADNSLGLTVHVDDVVVSKTYIGS